MEMINTPQVMEDGFDGRHISLDLWLQVKKYIYFKSFLQKILVEMGLLFNSRLLHMYRKIVIPYTNLWTGPLGAIVFQEDKYALLWS